MNTAPQNDDLRATWFGQVSPDWRLARAKNAFRVISKKVGDRSAEYDLLSLTLKGIIPRDLDSGKGKFPESFDTYQEVKRGDIVFCLFDIDETPRTVGLSAMDGMVTGAYTVVRCTNLADPRYVTYFYLSIDERKGLRPFYTGLRKVVRTETFLNASFPLPDLATQRKIADFLDRETARIDLLIEKKQRLLALLGERNNVARSKRLIGLRDRHGERKLSHVCLIQRGRFNYRPRNAEELYDGEFPFLQTGDVARAKKFITEHKQTLSGLGASISKKFKKGTVLMAIAANVGDVAIIEFDAFCPDSVVGFMPEKKVDTEFLYYVLKGAGGEIATSSTSNAQDNTNIARLGAIKVPMPPKEEQVAIASEFARREEQEIKISQQTNASIDRLKEYRSALITAAVTGQIDVVTYAKSGTPDRRLDAIQEEMGA